MDGFSQSARRSAAATTRRETRGTEARSGLPGDARPAPELPRRANAINAAMGMITASFASRIPR